MIYTIQFDFPLSDHEIFIVYKIFSKRLMTFQWSLEFETEETPEGLQSIAFHAFPPLSTCVFCFPFSPGGRWGKRFGRKFRGCVPSTKIQFEQFTLTPSQSSLAFLRPFQTERVKSIPFFLTEPGTVRSVSPRDMLPVQWNSYVTTCQGAGKILSL